MSPTIPIKGKGADQYAFRFFSSDMLEPPHVHVYRGNRQTKIWLNTPVVAWNRGYNPPELNKIPKLVRENRAVLLEAWKEYFREE